MVFKNKKVERGKNEGRVISAKDILLQKDQNGLMLILVLMMMLLLLMLMLGKEN